MRFARLMMAGLRDRARAQPFARFTTCAALLCAALALVLFAFRDLPMMDLPQHAAQIATWARWDALAAADRATLELNLRTPYLLAYPIARALLPAIGALAALKLIVWLAAVLSVWAWSGLARRLGYGPWPSLLAIPLSFGFSFYLGFVSFLLAMPLVIFAVCAALDHAGDPRWQSGFVLSTLLCLLLLAHGFALLLGVFALTPLLLFGSGLAPGLLRIGRAELAPNTEEPSRAASARLLAARLFPLAAPITLGLLWLAPNSSAGLYHDAAPHLARAVQWLPMVLGAGSYRDHVGVVLSVVLALALALFLGRPVRAPGRWGLLLATVAGYALLPEMFCSTAFLHERCVGFLAPALMLVCEPRRSPILSRAAVPLTVAACGIWLAFFGARLFSFNREMADYHALADHLPAGLNLRPLIFERDSQAFPGTPAFLHVSAYYHVEKGGLPAYSFAVQPSSVVRYRAGVSSQLTPGMEWQPERFDAASEAEHYDYFLVRGAINARSVFANSPVPISLDRCRGSWCGYRRELTRDAAR